MRFCVLVAAGLLGSLTAVPPITAQPFEPLSKAEKTVASVDTAVRAQIDCGSAVDVQLGEMVCGDNTTAPNNVDVYGCSPWPETGGEVVYRLTLATPTLFEVRLQEDCDLDVAILIGCDADLDCLEMGDTGIKTNEPVMGEFFVVVDGYNGASCGFCLEFVEIQPPFIDPTACSTAHPTSCAARTWTQTTCGKGNDVEYARCSRFDEAGQDAWYRVALNPGGSIVASAVMADADVALWLLDGCGGDFQCLAYADEGTTGDTETIEFVHEGETQRTLFLVVDSFVEPAACASYELEIVECVNGVVATGPTSWSTLKSTFGERLVQERR